MRAYHNFIIVGTQRTGSSVLAEAIGAHPQIACGWEWTQRGWRDNKIALAERGLAGDFAFLDAKNRAHMAEVIGRQTRWLGFRRLFRSSDKWLLHPRISPPLWVDRFEAHLRWLRRRPDIHVVHIVRNDSIEWIKSRVLAREHSAFVGKTYGDAVVTVKVRQAVRRLQSKNWVDARLRSLVDTNPYVCVQYEDFVADEASALARVYALLNCDLSLSPARERKLRKQSTQETRDYISNYDELVAGLSAHGLLRSAAGGEMQDGARK
jgi:LPS sulfotransferase NodH